MKIVACIFFVAIVVIASGKPSSFNKLKVCNTLSFITVQYTDAIVAIKGAASYIRKTVSTRRKTRLIGMC